jgi:CRP/FNR family transcriptional regulator, dissimilatory nitrate respiration regulator
MTCSREAPRGRPEMASLTTHPQRNTIRLQLHQNLMLRAMTPAQWDELEVLLAVADYRKGDLLVRQGDSDMEQFFILDGMLKRVVSNAEGHEMILRFAAETEMDTSYAAWRLGTPVPYSIVAVTKVRTAKLALPQWVEFLEHHPSLKSLFEYEVMKVMSEVMAHTITLHLLDAPGRLSRFQRKHSELSGRIPKKELAAYLNLTPETLSRLKQKFGER